MQSNYKGVDKTLSISSDIRKKLLKAVPYDAGLEEVIHAYNDIIAEEYELQKTKEAKEAVRNTLLFLSYALAKNLSRQFKVDNKNVEKMLLTNKYKRSINKAINYATQNANIILGDTVNRPPANINGVLVIKRMTSRADVIINTVGVEASNVILLEKAKEKKYKEFTFEAVIDERTSDICRSMNGKTFPIEMYEPGVNVPPLHPNCRSIIRFN